MPWKKKLNIYLLAILLAAAFGGPVFSGPPKAGGVMPGFSLPVPGEIQYRQYLGLDDQPEFKLSEIKADVVIIQIFSMY